MVGATAEGYQWAFRVAAVFAAGALVLAALVLRNASSGEVSGRPLRKPEVEAGFRVTGTRFMLSSDESFLRSAPKFPGHPLLQWTRPPEEQGDSLQPVNLRA
ncbi:hypothetical protein SALBM217S_07392 [Streptomyces griseoloalbus]